MPNSFFEQLILNSPYAYPGRHWEFDADGQPNGSLRNISNASSETGI
jgi:type III restriction enzyme